MILRSTQPDQLGGGLIVGEVAARFDDLAQLHVDALDGVGRVDDLAHGWREGKKRNHPIPGIAPGSAYGGKFCPQGPCSNACSSAWAASALGAV